MKILFIIMLSVGIIQFNCTQSFSQHPGTYKKPSVSYIESSSGLANPEWEGGRTELEFADINGDGNIDIITIGDHGNPGIQSGEQGLMVYFGDGQGHWSVVMEGELGYGGIAAGDVNNDGHMDVGYGMHHNYSSTDLGNQLIEVALGDGTGAGWIPWDDGLASNGEDWGMFGTDFADVDNDGDLDIGSISFGCCSGIHIYKNNLDGTWTQSFGFNSGNSGNIFQFGDINNDGFMDYIVEHESGTAYFGDGAGNFTINDLNLPSSETVGRIGPSLGDADNDGGMDLAFTTYNGGLHVYLFKEEMDAWQDFSGNLPASGDFEMTQLADMNMDGFIDVAAFGNGNFQVFLGNGQGNWTADATFTVGDPGSCKAFRVGGDFDHNGYPDMVMLEEEGTWISYQNHLKCFKENSVTYSLTAKPVFPGGHELFRPGSVRFIEWISSVPLDEPFSAVTLEYAVTGPEGPWTLIADQLPNNGRFQWIIPQENSSHCYIRYSISAGQYTAECISPADFTITDGTIGIKEEETAPFQPEVFPNPVGSQIMVNSKQSLAGLEICDMFGQSMMQFGNISTLPHKVDVSGLNEGIYLLRITSDDGACKSVKFLKVAE